MPQWPLPPGKPNLYPSTPGGLSAPTLADWQFEYNGFTFGAGQTVDVKNLAGLAGLPSIGATNQPFPRDTGEFVGVDALAGRDISLDLIVPGGAVGQLASLGAAFPAGGLTERPLWFQLPGLATLCAMCRPRSRVAALDLNFRAAGVLLSTVDLHATDPRLYEQASTASNTGTSLSVVNAGNIETRPIVVLHGPLTAPGIANTTIGSSVQVAFAAGTSIASGDDVVIDFSTPHTVQYFVGGITSPTSTYSVYDWVDQSLTSWWTLEPGANALTVSAASSFSSGAFEVWWANALML